MSDIVHGYWLGTTKNAPDHIKEEYRKQGLSGTMCGYVRENRNVAMDREEITCKRCIKFMKK